MNSISNMISIVPVEETIREIRQAIAEEVRKQFEIQQRTGEGEKLFYVAQVAKRLGKSHKTIKQMIKSGVLRATADGKITAEAIEAYLKGE